MQIHKCFYCLKAAAMTSPPTGIRLFVFLYKTSMFTTWTSDYTVTVENNTPHARIASTAFADLVNVLLRRHVCLQFSIATGTQCARRSDVRPEIGIGEIRQYGQGEVWTRIEIWSRRRFVMPNERRPGSSQAPNGGCAFRKFDPGAHQKGKLSWPLGFTAGSSVLRWRL